MSGHYGRKVQRRTAYEVSFGESQTSHDTIRKRPLSPSRQGSGSVSTVLNLIKEEVSRLSEE